MNSAEKTGLSVKIAQELCAQFDYDAPADSSWELASDSTKQFWLKIADIALMVIEKVGRLDRSVRVEGTAEAG